MDRSYKWIYSSFCFVSATLGEREGPSTSRILKTLNGYGSLIQGRFPDKESIYMIDPFIWSIHLYDRSIYMIDPFIWSNLTKYHHFSKHLVHKWPFLIKYDNLGQECVKKQKQLRGIVNSHVRVWVKKNHPNVIPNNSIQLSYQIYYI